MKHLGLGLLLSLTFCLGIPFVANAQPVPPDCMHGPNIRCDKPQCRKFCDNGHHPGHNPHHAAPPAPPAPPHHAKPVPPAPPAPPHHAKPVPPAPPAPPAPPHHVKPVPPPPPAPPHHVKPVPPPPPAPPVVVVPPPPHRGALERELRALKDENIRLHHDLDVARDHANHEYDRCMRIMFPFNGGCERSTPEVRHLEQRLRENEHDIARVEHELHIR